MNQLELLGENENPNQPGASEKGAISEFFVKMIESERDLR